MVGRPKGAKSDPNRIRLPFTQGEIVRAVRGVLRMGLTVSKIEIHPRTGLITITPGPKEDSAKEAA
jgi:hypothetical protein